jgi:hypothetical protein
MVESEGLHTRNLCEFCLFKVKGDIQLQSLVSDEEWKALEPLVTKLHAAYGIRENPDSPRMILNQMLMHPTDRRGASYSYDAVFSILQSKLDEIIAKLRLVDGPAARLGCALVGEHATPQEMGGNEQQNRARDRDAVTPQEVVFRRFAPRRCLRASSAGRLVDGHVAQQ